MASIATSIELYDKLSAPINNMIGAINNMIDAYHSLDSAVGKGLDPGKIHQAEAALIQAQEEVDELGKHIRENEQNQKRFNDEVDDGSVAMGGLVNKVMGLAGAYMSIRGVTDFIANAMEGSNLESSIEAQLKNVLKNVGATKGAFEELQEEAMNFESEGMYGAAEMLAGAGELATYISDTDAIKSMMGTLSNYAAGMSGGGALNSDQIVEYGTQLGKALMGTYDGLKKKGFELTDVQKKIIDETATQSEIAKELGMTLEEVAETSEDMQKALVLDSIIGESWDGLYESMSNTPEGQISMLQNAWGDVMDSIGYQLTPSVMSLFATIRENMPGIKQSILGITAALSIAVKGVELLVDNWAWLAPIIGGVATAIGLYTIALGINNAIQWASNVAKTVGAIAALAHKEMTMEEAMATTKMTEAQLAFNAALYASPLTWIVLIIIAVIAAFYILINVINKFTGKSLSATGMIVGALLVAVAFIWNLFLGLLDLVLAVVNWMWNGWATFANFFANLFNDPIASIIHLFGDMADNVLGILESIAKAMDKLFGSNMAGAVQGWRSGLDSLVESAANKYGNGSYEKLVDEINLSSESLGLKRWAYGDAYNTGYKWGAGIGDKISDAFDGTSAADNIAQTAENTGKAADSLEVTSEDLKYLRDIAERDTVNRFTTAEIKVDMTNHNSINKDMDLDGIVDYLVVGVNEAMSKAAEGVYA